MDSIDITKCAYYSNSSIDGGCKNCNEGFERECCENPECYFKQILELKQTLVVIADLILECRACDPLFHQVQIRDNYKRIIERIKELIT